MDNPIDQLESISMYETFNVTFSIDNINQSIQDNDGFHVFPVSETDIFNMRRNRKRGVQSAIQRIGGKSTLKKSDDLEVNNQDMNHDTELELNEEGKAYLNDRSEISQNSYEEINGKNRSGDQNTNKSIDKKNIPDKVQKHSSRIVFQTKKGQLLISKEAKRNGFNYTKNYLANNNKDYRSKSKIGKNPIEPICLDKQQNEFNAIKHRLFSPNECKSKTQRNLSNLY